MTKFTDLTDIGVALTDDDLFMVTNSPGSTPLSRKVTMSRVKEQSGGLLTYVVYRPGSDSAAGTTTSSTHADVNASITVTFTAPPSGKVLYRATAAAQISTSGDQYMWNIRDAVGDIANTKQMVMANGTANAPVQLATYTMVETGLTPGTSYTRKLGHGRGAGSGTCTILVGPTFGAVTMEVWSIPQ